MKAMNMLNRWLVLSVLAVLAAAGASRAETSDAPGDPIAGRKLAMAWCSNCHALAGSTQATATGAPAFQAIAADHAITALSLRAFLQTSHQRMPDLHLSNSETDDLIAYILSTRGG